MNVNIKKIMYFLVVLIIVSIASVMDAAVKHSSSKQFQYSINLMWMNKTLDKDQLYIFPLSKTDLDKNATDLKMYKADLDSYKAILEKKTLDTYKGKLDHYKLALWTLYQFLAVGEWSCKAFSWQLECQTQAEWDSVNLVAYKAVLDKYKTALDTYKEKIETDEDFPERYNDRYKMSKNKFKIDKTYLDEAKAIADRYKTELEQCKAVLDTYKDAQEQAGLTKANLDIYKDNLIKIDLDKNFFNHIYAWAEANQEGVVNVWFDSELVPKNAVSNTQALINDYIDKHPKMAPIRLQDIRKLPCVIDHPKVFSEKIPVYFRVDLLRPIIALYMLSHGTSFFVHADFDMEPLAQAQLFDTYTMQNLKRYGIVMAYADGFFENSFQMVSNNNENLITAMEYTVVELNIQRAYNALEGRFHGKSSPLGALEQAVYFSYHNMFLYFYYLEKTYQLKIHKRCCGIGSDRVFNKDDCTDYDKEKDGLKPFGLYEIPAIGQWLILDSVWVTDDVVANKMPVKMVHCPPSRFDFLNKRI